ncbi:MAG: hypothetical protein CME20_22800 [Gemmatimonadetes bacterium]|nr:hypothetical protein [Gemmatimonadota bacterium]
MDDDRGRDDSLGRLCQFYKGYEKNNEGLMTLRVGMSKTEVMSAMGKPDIYECFQNLNGKQTEILFYYTKRKWKDGTITKDECTPVGIEDGKLIGFGSEMKIHITYYESGKVKEETFFLMTRVIRFFITRMGM